MEKNTITLWFCILTLLITAAPGFSGQRIDNGIYADLLQKHVRKNGSVDYTGFKADEEVLDQYLGILSATNIKTLNSNEQFAFYINAYNAFTIKLILTKYPGINSIKEIGSFFTNPWQIKFISLNGRKVTLDYIEHEVLRPRFKDPRVHFAINCASKGCPRLRNEPYEAIALESQLEDAAHAFINDPHKNFFKGNTLFLSRIFKWFDEDFADNPLIFIQQYADNALKSEIISAGPDMKVSYLPYDWSLNQ